MIKRVSNALWRRRNFVYAFPIIRNIIKKILNFEKSHNVISINGIIDCFDHIGLCESEPQKVLGEAELYMNDTYELFGIAKQIRQNKWHQDFKTGYLWPVGKAFFLYKTIDYKTHSDVKFPWDMSRSHHLLILGQAYKLTGEEKYADKIKTDIVDFISTNPFMQSINWTCTMDVAIRSANWIYALAMMKDSEVMKDSGFLRRITSSLYEHKFFIEHNLEKFKPCSGNHYVADLAGLIHIYIVLGVKGDKFKYAVCEYQNEIREQVLPSGFHFEKSTAYHKLVFEMVLYTFILLRQNHIQIDDDVTTKIKDMAHFLSNIMQPDGNIPFIADNDNGRFLPFVTKGYADASQLINVASNIFPEEHFVKLGKSTYYDDAKMAVLRKGLFFATIHNNPLSGHCNGIVNETHSTHTHCDMLSFTLSDGVQNLIVDPGTFCYSSSPELRFKFKSTCMHNTVCVDGLDQQKQNKSNLFSVTQYSFPIISELNNENEYLGEYVYRDQGKMIYKHRRTFALSKNGCNICDIVITNGDRNVKSYLHFTPQSEAWINDNKVQVKTKSQTYEIELISHAIYSLSLNMSEVSESYGRSLPSPILIVDFGQHQGELSFETKIYRI